MQERLARKDQLKPSVSTRGPGAILTDGHECWLGMGPTDAQPNGREQRLCQHVWRPPKPGQGRATGAYIPHPAFSSVILHGAEGPMWRLPERDRQEDAVVYSPICCL